MKLNEIRDIMKRSEKLYTNTGSIGSKQFQGSIQKDLFIRGNHSVVWSFVRNTTMVMLFCMFCLKLSAQDTSFHMDYYSKVNRAEQFLIEKKWEEAKKYYIEAFSYEVLDKDIDLANALYVSAIDDDKQRFLLFLSNLEKNFSKKSLNKLRKDKDISTFLNTYPIIKETFYEKIETLEVKENKELIRFFKEMDKKDQHYRIKRGSYKKWQSQIDSVDNENIQSLKKLFREKGLPTNSEMGLSQEDSPLYSLVLIHYFQKFSLNSKMVDEIYPFLFLGLKNGIIDPQDFASFIDLKNDDTERYCQNSLWITKKNKFRISNDCFSSDNLLRDSIGLEKNDQRVSKICFQKKHYIGLAQRSPIKHNLLNKEFEKLFKSKTKMFKCR